MLEIIQVIIVNMPAFMPVLFVLMALWAIVGWFYVSVLGKEFHDFVVVSVMILIVLLSVILLINRDIQMLFFGNI